jgi:hypothetical protein
LALPAIVGAATADCRTLPLLAATSVFSSRAGKSTTCFFFESMICQSAESTCIFSFLSAERERSRSLSRNASPLGLDAVAPRRTPSALPRMPKRPPALCVGAGGGGGAALKPIVGTRAGMLDGGGGGGGGAPKPPRPSVVGGGGGAAKRPPTGSGSRTFFSFCSVFGSQSKRKTHESLPRKLKTRKFLFFHFLFEIQP